MMMIMMKLISVVNLYVIIEVSLYFGFVVFCVCCIELLNNFKVIVEDVFIERLY